MAQDSSSERSADSNSSGPSSEKLSSKRSPNWSDHEIRTLCRFVKEHKVKLFGLGQEANKKGVNAAKKQHWELAAAVINEQCDRSRHWSQVRKKWKDLSYYARNIGKKKFHHRTSSKPHRDRRGQDEGNCGVRPSEANSFDKAKRNSNELVITDPSLYLTVPNPPEVNFKREMGVDFGDQAIVSSSSVGGDREPRDIQQLEPRAENGMPIRSICSCVQSASGRVQDVRCHSTSDDLGSASRRRDCDDDLASAMSAYERARLEIEREKFALQQSNARYLRKIAKGIHQIGAALSRVKRRRNVESYLHPPKRKRWSTETESSA